MAATTAPPKQTLHNTPALAALGGALHFLPHHTRPFRRRHILFLILAVLLAGAMTVELATIALRRSFNPRALFAPSATVVKTESTVKSGYGFTFRFDNQLFSASVDGEGMKGPVSEADLRAGHDFNSVIITPLPSRVPTPEAAAVLEVRSETDAAAFAAFKDAAPRRTDIHALLANYFAPKPTNVANIQELGRTTESIGGTLMTKAIYQVNPKFAGKPTHTIVWTAEVAGKPLAITIQGIMAGAGVPTSMVPILQSMDLESATKVQGLSIANNKTPPTIEQKYVADLVSPSVVKVYHVVCGQLVFKDSVLAQDSCNGTTGSGFLVTADGYVATNGHVVVYGAKDMLVNALLNDQNLLKQFLSGTTLNAEQINEVIQRPDLTASVVSNIYDLPDSELRLANQRERTIVAMGDTPLDLKDEMALRKIVTDFKPRDDLKQATVVGYDYDAKDQLTVLADPEEGFSASDVALLKIATSGAPIVQIDKPHITAGQAVTVLGFPTDADNELTDNSLLSVSATTGTISSVRDAAGSDLKLYQSDVDASHGNSGGPALDSKGKVFGLLTYRFTSGEQADSAKSYIRDIQDFTNLAKANNVAISGTSSTQDAWRRGLDLYSRQHYSEAIVEFKKVAAAYPAHRLAGTYIELSKTEIGKGNDVKDPSVLLFVIGLGIGLGGLALAVVLIARHHGHHQVYRAYHRHAVSVLNHGS